MFSSFSAKAQTPVISSFSPTSARTGLDITITGSNFAEVTAVSFGGVPAREFSVIDDNTIKANVGAGASGSISISGATGNTSIPGFTYLPPPLVTSFSPTSGGKDTVITIRGSKFTNANSVRFGFINAVSFTVTSDTTILAVVGTGNSGNVEVRTPNGTHWIGGFVHLGPTVRSFLPTGGTAGTTITIKGTKFTPVTAVTIGGVPVTSFSILSDTAISAVVPANASGTIQVISPFGTNSAPGFNQSYISFFTPIEGPAGTVVTIKGHNFTNASAVSFGGTPATAFTITGDTVITATVGNGSYGVVSVTTPLYGTFATPSNRQFYYYELSPTFLSFSPKVGGPGTVISLRGYNFTGVTSVKFSEYSVPAASFTVVSDSLIEAVVGNGASGTICIEKLPDFPNISFCQSNFVFTTLPRINAISPQRGPVGSVVKISGINFGTNDKTVYIGGVKAPVIASSINSVTAVVPPAAGTQPVTVTRSDSLTAAWYRHFAITYPGDTSITPNSFSLQSILVTRGSFITGIAIGDYDGDGRKDIVVNVRGNTSPDTLIVYKNTSVNGVLSFNPIIVAVPSGIGKPYTADFDGDGKLDLASPNGSVVSIYRNTSTMGTISFAAPIGIYSRTLSSYGSSALAIGDFDGDGKPDMAAAGSFGYITLLLNTTVNGSISFIEPLQGSPIQAAGSTLDIKVADLNKDNKPEIIGNAGAGIEILRNTSPSVGNVSFVSKGYLLPVANNAFSYIDIGDLNGDLTPDIIASTYDPNTLASRVHVVKNVSSGNIISITPDTTLIVPVNPSNISVVDVNGDNKPEVITSTGHVWNNSSNAGIRLGSLANCGNYGNGLILVNDLDGDGKPEIIQLPFFGDTVFISTNKVQPNLRQLCPPIGSTAIAAGLSGSTFQWQVNTGAGFANIADTGVYTGTTASVLQITNMPTAGYGYKYRCIVNGSTISDATEIRFRNIWIGAAGAAWENPANWSCGNVPDAKTDVVINVGTVVINSNVTIKSLVIDPSVSLTVNSGYMLTITN